LFFLDRRRRKMWVEVVRSHGACGAFPVAHNPILLVDGLQSSLLVARGPI